MLMIKIAPSILSADFARLGEEIQAVEAAGADYIHVDVMDGHFVPNLTIGPPVVKAVGRIATKPLDVHLMITPVDPYIEAFAKAGAEVITVHAEAVVHLDRTLNLIRELGCRPGLALNPATPACNLGNVMHLLDMVVLMSVNPGFGGQSFIPNTLKRIRRVRKMIEDSGRAIELEVDGGIKPNNIAEAAQAGADVFVAGSAVFNQPDYAKEITALRSNAQAAIR
ncbi:MAG: ribulose-phosphate 3-epimerase [Magnetococcales bacterium]|nr:ribulose-phosphate 3-epimerase [Magnetococcales bacterium]